MTRRELLGAASAFAFTTLLGAGALGCGDSSGRQLGPTSSANANLVVENRGTNTLDVYLDGNEIGNVSPQGRGRFQVLSGTRRVEVREVGHSSRHSFGDIFFGFNDVELTYRP